MSDTGNDIHDVTQDTEPVSTTTTIVEEVTNDKPEDEHTIDEIKKVEEV